MNRLSAALLFVALAAPVSAAAQNPPDSIPADSVRFLGGITVSVAKPGMTSGGSSSVVIDLDSLGSIPAPSMDQVLRAMPLMQIRQNSRGEMQPAMRGSEDRQIAILMDGVPLTVGWDHRSDMSIIPLTAARNITLVRGLSSVLYGPNTLGGVVEVDVARAQSRIGSVDPLILGMSLDGTVGTNVSITGGHLIDDSDHQWVFRAGAGFMDRPGSPLSNRAESGAGIRPQFLEGDDLRMNSDARRVDGFFTARYRADEGVWGTVSASGYDAERGVPPEAHQDDPRLWRYPEQRRLIAAVSGGTGQRETGSGTGDIEASFGVDLGSTRIEEYATTAYQDVVESEDSDDVVLTGRLLAEHTVGARGNVKSSLTYADVMHDEVITPGDASSYRQRLWSAGVETEWRLGGNRATTLSLGAAYDGSDTPESADKPPVDRIGDWAARAGMTSLIADGVLLHGAVSRRSRFPSLRELYSGALGRFEPNPDLKAETLVGSEAGVTVTSGRNEVQLVGFHHRLSDGIVRRTVVGTDMVSRFQRVNQDQVLSTGAELLVATRLGVATVNGDITLQSVKGVDGDGLDVELEYEPTVVGKLGIDFPIPADFHLGGEARYMGTQSCENPEVGGLQPLPASTSIDATLRRLFSIGRGGALSRLDASASVQNITDAAVFDQCGLPQPGRLLQIQFRLW